MSRLRNRRNKCNIALPVSQAQIARESADDNASATIGGDYHIKHARIIAVIGQILTENNGTGIGHTGCHHIKVCRGL